MTSPSPPPDTTAATPAVPLDQPDERFRLLVESVIDYAIFMLDPEGRIVTWNTGAQRLKGYAAHEIVGRSFETFYPPEAVAAGWPREELRRATRLGRFEDTGWRVRKDGSRFMANVVITRLLDAGGRLVGFAKVTRDLSEQRRLAELELSSQRTNEFIGMLSHELRNPLAPIRNAATILRMQPALPPPAAHAATLIDRQVGHLTRLVDDLLDAGRLLTGKIPLRPAPLDVRDAVQAAADGIRHLADTRGQTIALDLPTHPIVLHGDGLRLTQAVQNLLHNASRYSPADTTIAVQAAERAGACTIRVADQGIGIAPEALERVFDLFVQDVQHDAQRLPADSGLGIGLALARTLVELHGGRLEARSEGLGRGSEFTITLPCPGAEDAS